jgi:acyl dehydratase
VNVPKVDELVVGAELFSLSDGPLTITDFVRYQGASGDMNPVHHDTEFAQRAGFPTPFAVGMRQAGVLATFFTDRLGASAVRRFKVQWKEQAWPGDVLTYTATVARLHGEGDENFVDLEATVTRQTGGVHLQGWATFVLP